MTISSCLRVIRTIPAVVAIALTALPHAAAAGLPTVTLTVNGQTVVAEVATTVQDRATGLMNRFSLQQDHGMLFVFERAEILHFWMKNTYIPLSIAFLDANGRILNIEDMAPQTETTHPSKGPALFALEMRKGWFLERGIKAGDRVEGVATVRQ
jgi:uncharacterized membrane protein (UPF0127 family)